MSRPMSPPDRGRLPPPERPHRDLYAPAPIDVATGDLYGLPEAPEPVTRHDFNLWVTPEELNRSAQEWLVVAVFEELTGQYLP